MPLDLVDVEVVRVHLTEFRHPALELSWISPQRTMWELARDQFGRAPAGLSVRPDRRGRLDL
jgi:hypothetical protein